MDNVANLESGFDIDQILLIENSFSRINNVIFDEKVENNVHISVDVNVSTDKTSISVAETIAFDQKFQETEQVKLKVKMVGVFKVVGSSEINDLEEFGRVNGAAIIYPYIREYITTICLKAGLGPIILPPANFTKQ